MLQIIHKSSGECCGLSWQLVPCHSIRVVIRLLMLFVKKIPAGSQTLLVSIELVSSVERQIRAKDWFQF